MRIIEFKSLSNGGHRNQTGKFKIVPDGWAVIPEDMETENFPFGEVVAEMVDGVMTVTSWTPTDIPESKTETKPTTEDILNTLLGVTE